MNRILKISLISAGGAVATALVSGISYFKGRKDGYMLAAKKYDGQLSAGQDKQTSAQPQA